MTQSHARNFITFIPYTMTLEYNTRTQTKTNKQKNRVREKIFLIL